MCCCFFFQKNFSITALKCVHVIAGYYTHVSTLADVQENVMEYLHVLSRPMVINHDHDIIWTEAYMDSVVSSFRLVSVILKSVPIIFGTFLEPPFHADSGPSISTISYQTHQRYADCSLSLPGTFSFVEILPMFLLVSSLVYYLFASCHSKYYCTFLSLPVCVSIFVVLDRFSILFLLEAFCYFIKLCCLIAVQPFVRLQVHFPTSVTVI